MSIAMACLLVCSCTSVVRADAYASFDESSVAALKAMFEEQMAKQNEEMAKQNEEMAKQKETIAALTAALEAKTEHKRIQLTTGGDVVELVSTLDIKALEKRVEACDEEE